MTTNDELINALSNARKQKIIENSDKEIAKWGGKRKGAGRKPINGVVLEFRINVSKQEKEFIKYAREHHIDYEKLM
ncbi:MAG: hypothetical protein PHC64_04235, partial [Candidatus Gastranaerophilales bacterium]|nr:hypothetical protein [Candidatus Gastranaerophilales bacterium]